MNPMRPGRRRWLARAGALGAVGLLSACASLTASQTRALLAQPPADLPARVEWTQVPFFPQEINQCGPAALATALGAVVAQAAGPMLPIAVDGRVWMAGVVAIFALSLVVGLLPALRARRLKIVDALAGR